MCSCLAQIPNGIALLPQPFVTAAQTKNDKIRVALDLNDEWDAIQKKKGTNSTLLTGIIIARTAFVQEHPEAVKDFLSLYETSINYTNNNVEEAAALSGKYEIIAEGVAKKAIPNCHIVYMAGKEMKDALSGYLNVLYDANPKSVGGTLPADAFYYGAE